MGKDSSPAVTIAIPTYNRAGTFLRHTIESATRQTYEPLEILVSDNCSSDHTEALVASLANPRLRYHRQSANIGANANFNFCLTEAGGDYFLLLHDDDLIDEDFITLCIDAAVGQPECGIVRTGTRTIDSEGRVLKEFPNGAEGLTPTEVFRRWFVDETALYLCSTLYRTQALRALGGFQSKHQLAQDIVATSRLIASGARADVRAVKASTRSHGGELTYAAAIEHWCEDSLLALDLICELCPQDAEVLRVEGARFFSAMSYQFAHRCKSWRELFAAYRTIYRHFQSPPPIFYRFFQRNPYYRELMAKLGR